MQFIFGEIEENLFDSRLFSTLYFCLPGELSVIVKLYFSALG